MSNVGCREPQCIAAAGAIELEIRARERELGGFTVRRVLPSGERRMVGPFIFFDHMGPAVFPPGEGIQVRPHPHVCLATVTYLFEGTIMHRDSLGYEQPIRPGAVNLMTAGRGIVHSERAGDDLDTTSRLHGIQSWLALPDGREEADPAFEHYPADALPEFRQDGVRVRIIMGEAYGHVSPVKTLSPALYLGLEMEAGSTLTLPGHCPELAAYVVEGSVGIDGRESAGGVMSVARTGHAIALEARTDCRVMAIGGDPVGERHVWWNFVASSKARIERAKADWREGRFAGVPEDDEFIPLPDR